MNTFERRAWRRVSIIAALVSPLVVSPAYGGATGGGYAELVRQVAPSVVTVLVEEKREGAGQRAAERATANSDPAGVSELLRRLLTGPGNQPMHHDGGDAQGSGFVIRAGVPSITGVCAASSYVRME